MKRVVVVDDDYGIRELLRMWLEDLGWTVTTAADGREALAIMRRGAHDVVLLDLMMPILDGWSVLEERQRDQALKIMPVVVMSAGWLEGFSRAESMGAQGWLSKPFDLECIMTTLERAQVGTTHSSLSP